MAHGIPKTSQQKMAKVAAPKGGAQPKYSAHGRGKDKMAMSDPKDMFGKLKGKKSEADMPPPGKRPGAAATKRKLEGKKL